MGKYGANVLLYRHHAREKSCGLPLAGQIVIDAAHDDGRAPIAFSMLDVRNAVPMYGMNAVVELLLAILGNQVCRIHDSQELLACLRVYPKVNTEEAADANLAAGFLHRFTYHGILGRFPGFNVAARLRDNNDAGGTFFNNQEFFIAFDNSANGEISR